MATVPLTSSWALKKSFPSVRLRSWRVSWRQGAMRAVGAFAKISLLFKLVPKRVYRFTRPENEWPTSRSRPVTNRICPFRRPQIGCLTSSQAEQSRAEPGLAEPGRANPSRPDPSPAEPFRAESIRAESIQADRVGPVGREPTRGRPTGHRASFKSHAEPSRRPPATVTSPCILACWTSPSSFEVVRVC